MLSPIEFYRLAMSNNGLEIPTDYNNEKVAEVVGKDVEVIKLAQTIQDQLIIDWYRNEDVLNYESKAALWDDAVKIAESYVHYVEDENKRANHVLDRAHAKLTKVAAEFIEDTGLDCEPGDLLKLASLHSAKTAESETTTVPAETLEVEAKVADDESAKVADDNKEAEAEDAEKAAGTSEGEE